MFSLASPRLSQQPREQRLEVRWNEALPKLPGWMYLINSPFRTHARHGSILAETRSSRNSLPFHGVMALLQYLLKQSTPRWQANVRQHPRPLMSPPGPSQMRDLLVLLMP